MILKNNLQDARRKFVDAKKRSVGRERQLGSRDGLVGELSDKTPSELARKREFDTAMQQAIAKLPTVDQQILQLRFHRTLTFAEIGNVIDIKPDTVRQRLPGILVKLQAKLCQFDSSERKGESQNV